MGEKGGNQGMEVVVSEDVWGRFEAEDRSVAERLATGYNQKPWQSFDYRGFVGVDPVGLEPTTPTLRVSCSTS